MKRLVLLVALFALPLAVIQMTAPIAAQASTSTCTPHADTPFISGGEGYAIAHTTGCSGDTFTYEVRFSTAGGTVLGDSGVITTSRPGDIQATAPLFMTLRACAGDNMRSFIWLNINGTVKSSQTNTIPC